jgi:hypothetical protein
MEGANRVNSAFIPSSVRGVAGTGAPRAQTRLWLRSSECLSHVRLSRGQVKPEWPRKQRREV